MVLGGLTPMITGEFDYLQEQVGVLLILQLSREGVTFRREFWTPEENVLAQNCDITRTWQGYLIHK